MKFYIIIPAHNEEDSLALTLESLATQTLRPEKVVVVNDNSSDATQNIAETFSATYDFIEVLQNTSSNKHLPGTKIINAFNKGLEALDNHYDVLCKFDADLIFPNNYLEKLSLHFSANDKTGMVSGFCYIQKSNQWILENLTRKDHIRGALKAYKKECFKDIGGLKPSIGWDTVDELLAKYYGWEILTDNTLHVKHLKPTGANYNKGSKYLQGEAMYKLRLGFALTLITALKMSFKKKSFPLFVDYIEGYLKAKKHSIEFLVDADQGQFIRKLRWKGIFDRFS
ncbi:glycosyltransferase family 2 protein [Ichthyenterobacterium sp. W332]|uniref:Glycosyltransferase family 2 protein n=1 Tax=Microcosmobacter mediterraneus TaxID=3075607 RepID=A0ABU2YK58_9FLAO|nr:glycosyltransferase family 2 protein [Ichthyenterobacterium sp. W332]MDT0558432.1 glycosyltransferase family 2 protein [Ichthyenterobacterium sp. W332]